MISLSLLQWFFRNCDNSTIKPRNKGTRQKTIFQALKVDKPETKVAIRLGFFENQKIVESLKGSAGTRRITAHLFEREARENSAAFPRFEKCVNLTGWKGMPRKRKVVREQVK